MSSVKRLFFLPVLLILFQISIAGNSFAWHFEYNYASSDTETYDDTFFLNASYSFLENRGFTGTPTENLDGSVDVSYYVSPGINGSDYIESEVSFQIVSDFGNTNQTPININIDKMFLGGGAVIPYGFYDPFEVVHESYMVALGLDTALDFVIDSYWPDDFIEEPPMGEPPIPETFQILTNTEYSVRAIIDVMMNDIIYHGIMMPDNFGTVQAYLDYFDLYDIDDPLSGSLEIEMGRSVDLVAFIDPNENPVPIPGAVVLFASGILGLLGIKRRINA
ncbi:MAG: hypothetical protein GY699_01125 [Desulfobacteraceae bacterium]|nr:hypothetical protein [Desulfobacteraceae bacterium]